MRVLSIAALLVTLQAEPLRWTELGEPVRALLKEAGLTEGDYPEWQRRHSAETQERLDAGAAEHIAYYFLQSRELVSDSPLDPAREARRYLDSLDPSSRRSFLDGAIPLEPIPQIIRHRMDVFWTAKPVSERHRLLLGMAKRLNWPPEKILFTAYRFLLQRSDTAAPDELYQRRGLSADPFPPSMKIVERGLAWLRDNRPMRRTTILLAGPGAELGARFQVDDSKPVLSPQPAALLSLLDVNPATFDCLDIRPEVIATLHQGPCRAKELDLVSERISGGPYDLIVATNIFVYLKDLELLAALANLSNTMKPGGCLIHNDSRFAVRPFGEAAGLPAVHFEAVHLGTRQGRQQLDRSIIHCKP